MKLYLSRLLLMALLLGWVAAASAVKPKSVQHHTYEDFAKGEATGISITPQGELKLAPTIEDLVHLAGDRVWSLVGSVDGSLYAGTGDEGRIFKIDPKGTATLLFDSPEIAIHALALGADGSLFAGTAPDGIIYRIAPDGSATTLAQTQAHYIWDLSVDDKGQLYAATGDPGAVLRLSAKGEIETLYTAADRHVRALYRDGDRLFFATAKKGRVYILEGPAKARLLWEADEEEISHLAGSGGRLYASGLSSGAGDKKTASTALYLIDPERGATRLWQQEKSMILALAAAGDDLLVTTSKPDRLYRFSDQENPVLLAQFDAFQPGSLWRQANGAIVLGATQSGGLFRLERSGDTEGSFEGAVVDFDRPAVWGGLDWRATVPKGTKVGVQTRSGNSAEPDKTWSSWSESSTTPGAAIASPPGRYLQYQVNLSSEKEGLTPILSQVVLWGRQANLRPKILSLKTFPYTGQNGGNNTDNNLPPPGGEAVGRPKPSKSLRLIRWQALDPNGDKLSYSLYLRGAGQHRWKLAEENITRTTLLWETETMPEGLTQLKLVAADNLDNSAEQVLQVERVTPPFAIDHSPPSVELESSRVGGGVRIRASFSDRITPIKRAQYTVDYSDHPQLMAAADGLFDSRSETAVFTVEGLEAGEHIIAVQVWDQLDNIGVAQLVVEVE